MNTSGQLSLLDYPMVAGAKAGGTSRLAAEGIEASGRAQSLRDAVINLYRSGFIGTADECAARLHQSILAIRPRVAELHKRGVIVSTDARRQARNRVEERAMTRSYCPTPDCCVAPKRGFCKCQVTPAAREKQSAAMRNAWADPATREKLSAAMRKAWADPATREKLSAAMRKAWADPAAREKLSVARRNAWADPATREKLSAAMRKAWAGKAIPAHLRAYAAKLRRAGFTSEALRKAIEEMK